MAKKFTDISQVIGKSKRQLYSQYNKYLRVWRLLKRPTMEEFKVISKVSILGLLVIGALGFVISIVMKMLI